MGLHRADVRTPSGTVVEFQHSPITLETIQERETFYGDLMWVFDAGGRDLSHHGKALYEGPQRGDPAPGTTSLRHCMDCEERILITWHAAVLRFPRKGLAVLHCTKPVVLDMCDGRVFAIERVIGNLAGGFFRTPRDLCRALGC